MLKRIKKGFRECYLNFECWKLIMQQESGTRAAAFMVKEFYEWLNN